MVKPKGAIGKNGILAVTLNDETDAMVRRVATTRNQFETDVDRPNPHPDLVREILRKGSELLLGEYAADEYRNAELLALVRQTSQKVGEIHKDFFSDFPEEKR